LDDLQIAWENLETARRITQCIVDNATTSIPEIQLDLSRIHLCLGDLARANGQHCFSSHCRVRNLLGYAKSSVWPLSQQAIGSTIRLGTILHDVGQ
jgi:hypothetical protein